jgi:UrcA family protein
MSKILLAAAAVATLFAGSAMAETKTTAVPTGNVNFSSRADVNALFTQVELAAQSVCRTDSKNKYVAQPDRACVEKAVAQAVASANRPTLTAAYQARGGAASAMATNEQ